MWERRKFLARAGGETWLLKFAGLGAIGERKLARARHLHAAGWTAEPRGLVHGLLAERWHAGARPLRRGEVPIAWAADYLRVRAELTAPPDSGASLERLLAMAERNAALALGEVAAERLGEWAPRLERLSGRVRRVETDNRMLPHEWLRLPGGRILKADALDHHAGHDLIGCQDIAWDVAGGAVELGFDAADLAARVGPLIHPELLEFLTDAYLAFRVGQSAMSVDMSAGNVDEQRRHRRASQLYAEALRRRLLPEKTAATQRLTSISLDAE
jgi:hypothetical protein